MEWHERLTVFALVVTAIFAGLVRGKTLDKIADLEARVEMLERKEVNHE